jgi:hypothetical protein
MSNNVLLISYKTVTENSIIGENYNPQVIRTQIKEVQEMHVEKLIGVALLDKIKSDINANQLTGAFKVLVNEKLNPVFIYGILEALPFAGNYAFANAGIVERTTSSHTKSVDPKELEKLSDYYKTRRVFYSGKVTEFIRENEETFSATSDGFKCNQRPKKEQYDVGIYLG